MEQTKKEQGFEEALGRLEAIVKEMERGNLSLEKMMEHFSEGSALVKYCGAKLTEVEKKIEVLLREGEGVTTKPYVPENNNSGTMS